MSTLNKSEKALLLSAVTGAKPGQLRYGKVFADSVEKKRLFNAALTLRDRGLVSGEVKYYRVNGSPCESFGHVWKKGYSGNQFSGALTDAGLSIALQLQKEAQ